MPYSERDKGLSKSIIEIYKDLAEGKAPPYQDPELPHTLNDASKLETDVLVDTANEINKLLNTGGDQEKVAELMSQASSAVEVLDEITRIRLTLPRGKL